MTIQYLAEQSATRFIAQDHKRAQIQRYIGQAQQLQSEYNMLNQQQHDLLYAGQLMSVHQQNRQTAAATNSSKPYVNAAFWDIQNEKQKIKNYQQIQQWLTKLHHWALRGYKVIVQMRKTITGQELIYHIQDTNNSFSYTLTESQYLRLLAGNNINMTYASTSQLEAVINKGMPMGDLFKLSINATQSKIKDVSQWSQRKGKGAISGSSLKNDALYQYLLYKYGGTITSFNGGVSHSRIYELHSQIAASHQWQKNKDGGIAFPRERKKNSFFFTSKRSGEVTRFANKYIKAGMHKDTIAFYKTGDAIQNDRTLIENKVGNAVVSIQTIRKAIDTIASFGSLTSKEQLKKAFINLFTYSGSKSFEKKIQDGARKFAVKQINELFKKS